MPKPSILVIVGPTASGKSDLAVKLAKKFNGEIISADSRQIYRGLNIGSGKITKREMSGVPHHLLDVANPRRVFSVAQYQKLAKQKIAEILAKNKLPIICGGTGFYIQAITENLVFPAVKPDLKLRRALQNKSKYELLQILQRLDPQRAGQIDRNNPRRLIRAIEIAQKLGQVPEIKNSKSELNYNFTLIGLRPEAEELKQKIKARLAKRLKNGLIKEVARLRESGLSWQRLESFGLEYKFVAEFLQNKLSKTELTEKLNSAIWHYTKRQLTWFKRDKRILWFATKIEAQKVTWTWWRKLNSINKET